MEKPENQDCWMILSSGQACCSVNLQQSGCLCETCQEHIGQPANMDGGELHKAPAPEEELQAGGDCGEREDQFCLLFSVLRSQS